MFTREVRCYQEVAPEVGVRVPACERAEVADDGSTWLEIEDLSGWRDGADPEAAAATLRTLHARWEDGAAAARWPWLARNDASELVATLFRDSWTIGRNRPDITESVRAFGDRLVRRVVEAERQAQTCGAATLTHGDASARNMKTSRIGEVALLDWEDAGLGPGATDLAWFLISSVEPADWPMTIAAYGTSLGLTDALPSVSVQAFLSLLDEPVGSVEALGWIRRISMAWNRLQADRGHT